MLALSTDVYLSLVTSEHNQKPKFMAWLAVFAQWAVDRQLLLQRMQQVFDIDSAEGVQLDATSAWVGQNRTPLGYTLDDITFRYLLRAGAAANVWDGSTPGAYTAYQKLFALWQSTVILQDNGDLTYTLGRVGPVPNATADAFLQSKTLGLQPATMNVREWRLPTVNNAPLFCLGAPTTAYVAGFGIGCWQTRVLGP